MFLAKSRRSRRTAQRIQPNRSRRLTMPEPLEVRATPGGSVLELLLSMPMGAAFVGANPTADTPLSTEELSAVDSRTSRLTAISELRRDTEALDQVLGEMRNLLQIASADQALVEGYVATAHNRIERVANAVQSADAAELNSREFLSDLSWLDDLFTSMAQAKTLGASGLSSEFALEGNSVDGVGTLDYGGPPPNYPPVANDDPNYQTKHDSTRTVSQFEGVLNNDYDPNYGTVLTASLVSGPSHAASFTFNSNGSFTYTPAPHFVGTDTFVYRASDGSLTDDAQVTINVWNTTPVANNDTYETMHDSTRTVLQSEGVLNNDMSGDGDPITVTLVSGPSHAQSFTLNANGSFTYRPATHFVGTDTFTYQATDGIANSLPATVSINVYNLPPVFNTRVEGPILTEDMDIPANGPIFMLGDAVGQMHATDGNGDTLQYSLDGNDFFSVNASTGVITVANPEALDQAVLSGSNITIAAHASDQVVQDNDTFTCGIQSIIPQRYIDLTTVGGSHYNPTSGTELNAALREIQTNSDTISVLIIKGHGNDEMIQTGEDENDLLTVGAGRAIINGDDMTTTLRAITGNGSEIKLRGCKTRPLADALETALNNGTECYGAVRYVIGIPGTTWTIGRYQ